MSSISIIPYPNLQVSHSELVARCLPSESRQQADQRCHDPAAPYRPALSQPQLATDSRPTSAATTSARYRPALSRPQLARCPDAGRSATHQLGHPAGRQASGPVCNAVTTASSAPDRNDAPGSMEAWAGGGGRWRQTGAVAGGRRGGRGRRGALGNNLPAGV